MIIEKTQIPLAKPCFSSREKELLINCLNKGWVSSIGGYVEQFAQEFSRVCRTEYSLCTSSGTTALHLALISLGINRNDEVIVPALSFVASANAVVYMGAKPVFIDCQKETWNMDLEQLEKKITPKTKAIIPVHLYGNPVDMDRLKLIARKYKLYLIEDAAESLGSLYKGRPTGGLGDIGCFSFFGNKIITTGEGGMLVTNNSRIYQRARLYRDQGKTPKKHPYWHSVIGYNYAMTNLQAAVGIGQLNQLKKFVFKKRKIAGLYNKLLKNIDGIVLPKEPVWTKSNYWMYSILVERKKLGISRNQLMDFLLKKGIETRPFFYPLPLLPPYKKDNNPDDFKIARKISSQGINLPSFSQLKITQIEYITDCIKSASKNLCEHE